MIPVPDLLALLSEQADNGDEDAAIQLNVMAPNYPPEVLLAARNIFPIPLGYRPPVIPEPTPVITPIGAPQTLGEIMAEAFASVRPSHDWELFESAVDLIAGHYGLHRDDAFDALLDLELEYAERHDLPKFGPLLETPSGFAAVAAAVAERVTGAEVTGPGLHLSIH